VRSFAAQIRAGTRALAGARRGFRGSHRPSRVSDIPTKAAIPLDG
jgi:hypothetical protein